VTHSKREFLAAVEASNGDLIPRPLSLHVCLPICTDAYLARVERAWSASWTSSPG
jgi:hypothetical protein